MRAWTARMERREEDAYGQLMCHVGGCDPCTRAVARGQLLDAAALCVLGARLLAAWDAAEDAVAATLALETVPA